MFKVPKGTLKFADSVFGVRSEEGFLESGALTGFANSAWKDRSFLRAAGGGTRGLLRGTVSGWKFGTSMLPFAPLDMAISMSTANNGEMVAAGAGSIARTVGGFAGSVLGGMALGPVGAMLGSVWGGDLLGDPVERGVKGLQKLTRNMRQIDTGKGWEDTAVAYTMRQRAALELSSSVMNARQWLGQESVLFHS